MLTEFPLLHGLQLRLNDAPAGGGPYATLRLQRGLLLADGAIDLAEEAVGFGVPVLKRGLQTLFPGSVSLQRLQSDSATTITARYQLNLVEKFSRGEAGHIENPVFYELKNMLAATIRHLPASRGPLTTASSRLREMFNWETTYAEAGFGTEVTVTYRTGPSAGKISIDLDAQGLRPDITEVVLMNEQGAHHFDRYGDSSGARLEGDQIGCWDEVLADEAWFESTSRRIAFRLSRVEGARLFRGRELIGSRLAWAGFGYSFSPSKQRLQHVLTITRLA